MSQPIELSLEQQFSPPVTHFTPAGDLFLRLGFCGNELGMRGAFLHLFSYS